MWHCLWDCHVAREVWDSSFIWSSLKNTKAVSFDGLCMDIGENGTRDELELFTAIAWALWQSRNARVHSKRLRDARDTIDLAGRVLGDFHLCNQIDSVKIRNH